MFMGVSFKTISILSSIFLLFGMYLKTLVYGENSIIVLQQVREEKIALENQVKRLKQQNQRLQKMYFELKQLEPKE